MNNITTYDFTKKEVIHTSPTVDVGKLASQLKKIDAGLLLPSGSTNAVEYVEEHASEPIKSLDDIAKISNYFIDKKKYRDNMLFIVGINFGLRVSDLLRLRFSDIINSDLTFKTKFPILEKKTSTTRKVNKNRYIFVNVAVMKAILLYLENVPSSLDNYMFRSESRNGLNKDTPISRQAVDLVLRNMTNELELNYRIATHSLRKTFGYHHMAMSGNDSRKLLLLQKMFGHSTSFQTLDYIGLTSEEMQSECMKLSMDGDHNYLITGDIFEEAK